MNLLEEQSWYHRLRALKKGWYGKDVGEPIEEQSMILAHILMYSITKDIRVYPTIEGGVQFEWRASGYDCDVELNPQDDLVAFDARTGIESGMHFAKWTTYDDVWFKCWKCTWYRPHC